MNLILRYFGLSIVTLASMFTLKVALAGGHRASAGAFSFMGGSNPVSFSSPGEFIYTYVGSSRQREFIVGLISGVGYAVRFESSNGFYTSLGGVIGVIPNTLIGPMSAFGWEFWCPLESFCLGAEFRSAVGLYSNKRLIPAYSTVQVGGTIWSN